MLMHPRVKIISGCKDDSFKETSLDYLVLLGESTPKNIRNEATEEPSTTEEINDYLIQRRGLILSYLLKGEPPDKQYIPKPKQYQGKTLESQNEMKADLFYLGAVYTVSRSKPFQEGVDVAVTKSMVQP
ncbi:hypothetical protein F2Q70_00004316 [Brassica cretica]|uniref:Uncharacterized protein n=1 Tax=Brassica cretica TaxID=69181 RepID=A0A8S9IL16_BRACR|nr:hypothetical protein F2Q70_00004316 [Brassica cretica]